ncbi:hypothetical protein [Geitlerinema sp. PCC 9228]|nr:hypothetical protein [Geitlerinema sp. PCC 9228]
MEIHIRDEEALMVGVPPHNFRETFHQAIDISIKQLAFQFFKILVKV